MKRKLVAMWAMIVMLSFAVKAQEVFVPTAKGDIAPLTKAVIVGKKKTIRSLINPYVPAPSFVIEGKNSSTILPKSSALFYIFNSNKNDSPITWELVPVKSKKNKRELQDMKSIPLLSKKIIDGVFELRAAADLKTGDYALVLMDITNAVPPEVYDFHVVDNLPPYPQVSEEVLMAEFNPSGGASNVEEPEQASTPIIRWYFDSDPRGARIFWRVISNTPNQVKNTNESYLTTTPLEETRALNIPGLTYQNSADVVIEVKLTKRGYEDQVKRYNVRQALDQQEISGFFELVEKK